MRDVVNTIVEGLTEDYKLSRRGIVNKLYKRVVEDVNNYVPYNEGYLQNTTELTYGRGSFDIEYTAPYAKYLYANENIDYSDKGNPNAKPYWFEEALGTYEEDWVNYLLSLVEEVYG